jgi:hypothetical protein
MRAKVLKYRREKKVNKAYGILQAIPEGRKERYYTRVVLLGNERENRGQATRGSYEVPGQRPMGGTMGHAARHIWPPLGGLGVILGVSEPWFWQDRVSPISVQTVSGPSSVRYDRVASVSSCSSESELVDERPFPLTLG